MAQNAIARCAQCGQSDDHPKVHVYEGETYHYDCLPYDLRADLVASAPHQAGVIDAANSGVHGDALRDHIVQAVAASPTTTSTEG